MSSNASFASLDGRLVLSGVRTDGAPQPVRSPWDGREVAQVHRAEAAQVEEALSAGHRAEATLRALPSHERTRILRAVAQGLRDQKQRFVDVIVAEAGKPRRYAEGEVERAIGTFDFAADHAGDLGDEALRLDRQKNGAGRTGIVRRFPVGLVAAVSPFNFPLNLVAHKLAPAIATGCPVVLKPASQTPLTALLLADVIAAAGLPAGGLSVVVADRKGADVLVTDPRVKLLTFTGSPDVGWDMKARAGKKRVVLELGGNAAVYLHDDADLDDALPRVVAGAFAYAGQVCISVQRVIAHVNIVDRVRDGLLRLTRDVQTGDPARADVVNGPLIDEKNAARVLAWIDEARAQGAQVLCGGAREGPCVSPTWLEHTPASARVYADEVFGPVACLEAAASADEALARVNASRFGLQVGVFTQRLDVLWRFFEGAEVGGVIHNDAPTFRVDHMPYGGVKDSGFGREGIPSAFADYTEPRLLALRP